MLRTYFLNETDQIIDMLTSTVNERQDSEVSQLSQEPIHIAFIRRSKSEKLIQVQRKTEPTENVGRRLVSRYRAGN